MPSYSVYLELVYEDLLASAGITLPPCSSDSRSSSSSSSGGTAGLGGNGNGNGNGADEDDGACYCQGYNLVMTSQVGVWAISI